MPTPYRLMYKAGFTPWDRDHISSQLANLVSGANALTPGRALDLGCGTGMQAVFFARHGWRVTGMQAVFFARHGWRVTGVDFVERALDMASERAAAAGAEVEWIHGDVTHLDELGLAPGYELIYDVGCFHALSDDERSKCAISLAGLASPSALLLLMGFAPGRRGPAPRGISRQQVASLFEPEWRLLDVSIDDEAPLPLFLRNARPTWYHMVKD